MRGRMMVVTPLALAACMASSGTTAASRAACEPKKIPAAWTATGVVYRSCEVDREAAPVGKEPALKWVAPTSAPRCNTAVAEFVIDTLGVPEPGKARLVSAMEPTLGLALMQTVPARRYTAAVKSGHAVRQVVRAPIIAWVSASMVIRTARDSLCKF